MPADALRTSPLAALGWACYLACSWTWCIGMFLPVLLVRDFGVWGFVIFAVPNVLGAAAMGWVLRTRQAAERLVVEHAPLCAAFSLVTVWFHVFFLAWLLTLLPAGAMRDAAWGVLLALLFIRHGAHRPWRHVIAAAVLAFSLATAIAAARAGFLESPPAPAAPIDVTGLLWLAPVCAFGFGLCPYLDATFLRARMNTSTSGARAAFSIGFGALFLALLLYTLSYAAPLLSFARNNAASTHRLGFALVALHMIVQALYTVGLHTVEWRTPRTRAHPRRIRIVAAAGWFLALAAGFMAPFLPGYAALSAGEIVYRLFMAFYGLVFPAYVWLCMIPTPDGHSGLAGQRGRIKFAAWMTSVALAAPLFWLGFIERQEAWLAPGLGIVLVARLCVRSQAPRKVPQNLP